MLTRDKLETATCIAKSSHLVSRNQDIHVFKSVGSEPLVIWIFKWGGFSMNALWWFCGRCPTGGSSGAECRQKETRLCAGHLRRLSRGKKSNNLTFHIFNKIMYDQINFLTLIMCGPSGLSALLRAWICWAGVSVPCCGLLSLLSHTESSDRSIVTATYRQQNMCHRSVLSTSLLSLLSFKSSHSSNSWDKTYLS